MTVLFQALLASLGALWLVGQVAFMINAPDAPRQEYLWLIASVAMMSVASLAGLAIALTTNTRRPGSGRALSAGCARSHREPHRPELFKQFMDNPAFKKWLGDTIFDATYKERAR